MEKRTTEADGPQRRPSGVHSANDSILPSQQAGFGSLVHVFCPVTLWSYITMADDPSSSLLVVSNCSPVLSLRRLSIYAKTAAPAEIWHQRRRNFILLNRKTCVNLGVPGRNILGLFFILTVNDISSEWWMMIVSCIQILISQDYGYNQQTNEPLQIPASQEGSEPIKHRVRKDISFTSPATAKAVFHWHLLSFCWTGKEHFFPVTWH